MNPLYKNNSSLRRTPIVPRNTKAIVLVDIINNTTTHYESVKLLLQDLGIKSTGATSLSFFLLKKKLFLFSLC